MKIYLVGGAVRDQLLHRSVTEKDWVVVGETQRSMLAASFQQVGKDFPVFLHPQTKEEYALARKERKVAKGYHGFEFDVTASVTLEEDLLRRDLTINAIAQDDAGKIIDPYHGVDDLKNKILRHVSPAFAEDPVRILRVARFSARFPDFHVADETNHLMKKMVDDGEVNALVAERVWKEFEKAMGEVAPEKFIEILDNCHALKILFPIFYKNKSTIIRVLKNSCSKTTVSFEKIIVMMLACDDIVAIKQCCEHYKAPHDVVDMIELLSNYQASYENSITLSSEELLQLFTHVDAFRREQRFKQWLYLCDISSSLTHSTYILRAYEAIKKIDIPRDVLKKCQGKEIGEYIEKQRLEKLKKSR